MRCKRPARWSFYHARPDAPETIELAEGTLSATPEASGPVAAAPVADAPGEFGARGERVAPTERIEK
jgi:hypothetical protein